MAVKRHRGVRFPAPGWSRQEPQIDGQERAWQLYSMFAMMRRARKQLVVQTDVTDDDAIAKAVELCLCHAAVWIYVDD